MAASIDGSFFLEWKYFNMDYILYELYDIMVVDSMAGR